MNNNKLGITDNKYKDDSAQVVAQNEVTTKTKTLRLEAVASSLKPSSMATVGASSSTSRTYNQRPTIFWAPQSPPERAAVLGTRWCGQTSWGRGRTLAAEHYDGKVITRMKTEVLSDDC